MRYSVVQADLQENRDEIVGFWQNNFPAWPRAKYEWFYEGNPSGSALCFIMRDSESGRVVGATAIFPRRFLVMGRPRTGGISADLAMDGTHRTLGPALKLQRAALPPTDRSPVDFCYGYPNRNAEAVLKRLGYKVLGTNRRLVRVLKSRTFVDRRVTVPFTAAVIAGILDFSSRLFAKETRYRQPTGLQTEILAAFDERFDHLWQQASPRFSIIAERTMDVLNWRFTHCPYRDYRIFALSRKSTGEILGYVVYDIRANSLSVADLFVADMDNYLDVLLSEFLLAQRAADVDSLAVTYFGNETLVRTLKAFGFVERESGGNIVVHTTPDSELSSALLDDSNWYLMDGDNDV